MLRENVHFDNTHAGEDLIHDLDTRVRQPGNLKEKKKKVKQKDDLA